MLLPFVKGGSRGISSAAVVSENQNPPCPPLGGKYEKYYVCDKVFFAGVASIGSFALMWEFQSFFITLLKADTLRAELAKSYNLNRRTNMDRKKRRIVRGQCPQCACGDVSFIPPEELKEKYSGPADQIEILCPSCGTKIKGQLELEEEK